MRIIASVIIGTAISAAARAVVRAEGPGHVIQELGEARWGPAPPFIPAGAQLAVLAGDPTKSGPYSVRLKFPANYAIPAHSHPTDENVVVVTGALTFGMGDKLSKVQLATRHCRRAGSTS